MIDTYVERLCDPGGGTPTEDSDHYEFKGKCVAMDHRVLREAATLPPPLGTVLPEVVVERTVHGPVQARGTLGGQPVAISSKRSSYMKELDAAVSILKMNRNQAKTGDDFVDIFRESHNLSTNWSYANDEEIAYVHGGVYPRRPKSVDPDFPVWGTGEWEWQTDAEGNDVFLGRRARCRTRSPRSATSSSPGTTARRPAGAARTPSGAGARSTAPSCSRTRSSTRSRARSTRCGSCR